MIPTSRDLSRPIKDHRPSGRRESNYPHFGATFSGEEAIIFGSVLLGGPEVRCWTCQTFATRVPFPAWESSFFAARSILQHNRITLLYGRLGQKREQTTDNAVLFVLFMVLLDHDKCDH